MELLVDTLPEIPLSVNVNVSVNNCTSSVYAPAFLSVRPCGVWDTPAAADAAECDVIRRWRRTCAVRTLPCERAAGVVDYGTNMEGPDRESRQMTLRVVSFQSQRLRVCRRRQGMGAVTAHACRVLVEAPAGGGRAFRST